MGKFNVHDAFVFSLIVEFQTSAFYDSLLLLAAPCDFVTFAFQSLPLELVEPLNYKIERELVFELPVAFF